MYVLDLFSGIGGFSLGLRRAGGFRTAAFCEIDPFCRSVLSRHWPTVPIHDDIRKLDGTRYAGTIDVVCGGFPCQPWSVAGQQRGEADERHLWPEMLRVIREVRPRYVVAENVPGIIKLGFDTVATQLEDEGFTVWPFVVPASAVGAPHSRERLWVVGYAEHNGLSSPAIPGGTHTAGDNDQEGKEPSGQSSGAGQPLDGCHLGDWSHTLDPAAHWFFEPDVGRMVDGLPSELDKTRIQAIGNAVLPQLPELIGRTIIAYERQLAA